MAAALQNDPGPAAAGQSAAPTGWPAAIHETVLPLLFAVAAIVVFVRIDQAREALFGTIGPVPHSFNRMPKPYDQYIGTQFFALAAAMAFIGVGVWYTARLLLTVERDKRHGAAGAVPSRVIEMYPRLIGALTPAVLIIALVIVQESRRTDHRFGVLIALLACLTPLCAVLYAIHRNAREWPLAVALLVGGAVPWFLIIAASPNIYDWQVIGALSILCYLPAALYFLFTVRRPLLRKVAKSTRSADANLTFSLDEALVRLLGMGIGGALLLLALSYGPPAAARALGSAAIVLISLTAVLFTLCAITLALRHITHNKPGFLLIIATAAGAIYLFLHGTFGWAPFEEQLGQERLPQATLPSGPRTLQERQATDIVVNAYGGGLRAALFTAEVLADLDDRSCGEFGRRLDRLSGVSGGSLGLAVYMLLRQEFVASGGWGAHCTPSSLNGPQLAQMVDDTLVQDHLSAAMARMLSTDLVPYTTPQRGQALLDSWQDTLTSVLAARAAVPGRSGISLAGLALPLGRLDGGIAPAPSVFFNATDVTTGERVWFSNRSTFSGRSGSRNLDAAFQVGQAVLHSARFPFVSPAGGIAFGKQAMLLVDGGYADNSGAGTLADTGMPGANRHWLNIDGNPPDQLCAGTDPKPVKGAFSAVDALFAVRESQAALAVWRYRNSGIKDFPLQPNLDDAFASTIKDEGERCKFIQSLHTAPLGWYLTPVTVGDQALARFRAVRKACDELRPLCGA
ncbi:hypothetical protein [Massilia sp. Root335]|uniref:hypothetical protein n=1 Tax=Massilia sp. Root335 TaxID=1736517 RepID=UPI000AE23FC5|nr:hypothetical protein [Massilia sp. Root335]